MAAIDQRPSPAVISSFQADGIVPSPAVISFQTIRSSFGLCFTIGENVIVDVPKDTYKAYVISNKFKINNFQHEVHSDKEASTSASPILKVNRFSNSMNGIQSLMQEEVKVGSIPGDGIESNKKGFEHKNVCVDVLEISTRQETITHPENSFPNVWKKPPNIKVVSSDINLEMSDDRVAIKLDH
ncbi:hypothetical protein MA16_Dca001854 [Dendrobium catenatum]|uniref:Uncharacterized protein n=1 Tax=Dendrobium catenatum TaxID=906689 RepID=A0A2I0XDP8_9ASPA|nr:hypothetical protein MA16_Dca001854 [Dendrobium catenatum]